MGVKGGTVCIGGLCGQRGNLGLLGGDLGGRRSCLIPRRMLALGYGKPPAQAIEAGDFFRDGCRLDIDGDSAAVGVPDDLVNGAIDVVDGDAVVDLGLELEGRIHCNTSPSPSSNFGCGVRRGRAPRSVGVYVPSSLPPPSAVAPDAFSSSC